MTASPEALARAIGRLQWFCKTRRAQDLPTGVEYADCIDTVLQALADAQRSLSDLYEGRTAVLPKDAKHARTMEVITEATFPRPVDADAQALMEIGRLAVAEHEALGVYRSACLGGSEEDQNKAYSELMDAVVKLGNAIEARKREGGA